MTEDDESPYTAGVEELATYGRKDGRREWVDVGNVALYPGDRIVVLRAEHKPAPKEDEHAV